MSSIRLQSWRLWNPGAERSQFHSLSMVTVNYNYANARTGWQHTCASQKQNNWSSDDPFPSAPDNIAAVYLTKPDQNEWKGRAWKCAHKWPVCYSTCFDMSTTGSIQICFSAHLVATYIRVSSRLEPIPIGKVEEETISTVAVITACVVDRTNSVVVITRNTVLGPFARWHTIYKTGRHKLLFQITPWALSRARADESRTMS